MLKFKTATLWGVIGWALIFVEISILIFIPILAGQELLQTILHLVILLFIVWLMAAMYFKKTHPSVKKGMIVGVYFLIIGTILDLVVTIPLFVKDYASFYSDWSLWVGYLELLVVSTLVGYLLAKKHQVKEDTHVDQEPTTQV